MPEPVTFHVPFALPTTSLPGPQEPKSASDTPVGVNPAGAGPQGSTSAPGTPQPAPAPGFGSDMFLWMALFVGLMLFLSMRREGKARKEQQAMLASIKKGDRVVTTAGMHAVVDRLDDKTVVLLLDTMAVTFDRAAIARVVRDEATRPDPKRS